jgi:hypothetical protein
MSARSKNKGRLIKTMETPRLELFLRKEILLVILNPGLQSKRFHGEWIRDPMFIICGEESRTQWERTNNVGVGFMRFGREGS